MAPESVVRPSDSGRLSTDLETEGHRNRDLHVQTTKVYVRVYLGGLPFSPPCSTIQSLILPLYQMGLDHLLSVIRLSTLTPHMIRAINIESIHNYGWRKRRARNLKRSITIQNADAVNHHIEPCFRVWNEPGQIVQAMAIHEPGISQINCLSTLRIKDAPLLFLNSNRPVLNKQVFGDLTCLSVARTSCGHVERLGSLHLTYIELTQAETIFEFLLRSCIVSTYLHIEAQLTFGVQAQDSGAWVFEAQGSHLYFTNDRCEEPLHFEISLNPMGDILVENFI